ncbi:MAG: amidohydrolase family protein [Candidatus Binatia bacterium]
MSFRVIDSDAHVVEGHTFMQEMMDRFPDKVQFTVGEKGPSLLIEGRRYPQDSGPGAGCPPAEGLCLDRGINPFTPAGVVADADREGIDTMVFFPSAALGLPAYDDQGFAADMARAYNRWLAQLCRYDTRRLRGVALVPIEDVPASIRILGDAKKLGLVGVMLPACLRARNLDHPDLTPFFAAAADLDMAVGIHGAPGVHLPMLGAQRFDNYLQVHCVSFPFDMMVALTSLVLGGVLERHPTLRVGLLESGVGWVPYFVERMHEHLEKRGRLTPACKHTPEEYIGRGQVFVSCEPDEAGVRFATEVLGADFIMYASDYPHWDSEFPNSSKPLRERTDIPDEAKAKILGESAMRFYGLQTD